MDNSEQTLADNSEQTRAPNDFGNLYDDFWPLVPEGIYTAGYVGYDLAYAFSEPRLFLEVVLLDPGDNFGKHLFRAYRMLKIWPGRKKGPKFKYARHSDFIFEMCRIGGERIKRPDRVTPNLLRDITFKARVETVESDYKQREKPEQLQYSVIREILGVDAGR